MVFGGTMHPNQDAEHPWLAGELGFIECALEDRVPLIGVCLGAQLIARAGGAWVGPAPTAEVGWFTVDVNTDGLADPVLGVLPDRIDAFQWHYFTFGLPDGAVALASSPAALQAYRLGDRVWGLQFHAEVERHMLESWFGEGREELGKPLDEMWAVTDGLLPTWNAHGRALCGAFLGEAARLRR
jgi:GMP synthase (glutamine-hydrolysing)